MNTISFERLQTEEILREISKKIGSIEEPSLFYVSLEKVTYSRPDYLTSSLIVKSTTSEFKVNVPFDYTEKEVRHLMDIPTEQGYKFKQRNDIAICSDSFEDKLHEDYLDTFDEVAYNLHGDEIDLDETNLKNPSTNIFVFK